MLKLIYIEHVVKINMLMITLYRILSHRGTKRKLNVHFWDKRLSQLLHLKLWSHLISYHLITYLKIANQKLQARTNLLGEIVGSSWGLQANTLRTTV